MTAAVTSWRAMGTCASHPNPDLWVIVRRSIANGQAGAAVAICHRCPVREQCAADAASTSGERRRAVILAGTVYDEYGRPLTHQLGVCRLPGCGQEFLAPAGTRLYCTDRCRRAGSRP